jgi:hypothetical protein
MKARGFTMVELSAVLACATVLLPVLWTFWWEHERAVRAVDWELQLAEAAPRISEAMAEDRRLGPALPGGEVGWAGGTCSVSWVVEEGALVRRPTAGCGPSLAYAHGIEAIRWVEGGVDVDFVLRQAPGRAERRSLWFPGGVP